MARHNNLISEYQTVMQSICMGKFDLPITVDNKDELGKLGYELNELARHLERKFDESAKVREISEEVTAGLFLDDVLNRVYGSFRPLIPYNRIGCALLNEDKTKATARWAKTDSCEVCLRTGYTEALGGSSLQEIMETGRPRIINDLEAYLALHPASVSTRLIVQEGVRSSLTCPLIAQGKPVGFLFFSSMEKNTYQDIHQGIFMQIAGQISILVEKSQMFQQLYELNQKLLAAQDELQHKATHDALTGIYNRGAITEHLVAQLARAKRHKHSLGIIMIDADHFKQINDTYGHLTGDAVLKTIAARMKACLREYDYIGRYGGEEFLVVLGDTDYASAMITAKRLSLSIGAEAVVFGGKRIPVTISAGIAVAQNCAVVDTEKLVQAADQQLYKAKSDGRNRVEACLL
jgi:diguanylate cyclase (GGDEF)-like protein